MLNNIIIFDDCLHTAVIIISSLAFVVLSIFTYRYFCAKKSIVAPKILEKGMSYKVGERIIHNGFIYSVDNSFTFSGDINSFIKNTFTEYNG